MCGWGWEELCGITKSGRKFGASKCYMSGGLGLGMYTGVVCEREQKVFGKEDWKGGLGHV